MTSPPLDALVVRLERLRAQTPRDERVMVGLAGEPGAGKSTLAAALVAALRVGPVGEEGAALVPMDGFHLANSELERLGRRDRKGAPDTFDVDGYVELLRRLRSGRGTVYAPELRRDLDEAVAGATAVDPSVRVVVTEGNYLLADGSWAAVRPVLDEVWFVELDEHERLRRLVARHVAHGRSEDAATAWALGPDQANAELVRGTRDRADLVVRHEWENGTS